MARRIPVVAHTDAAPRREGGGGYDDLRLARQADGRWRIRRLVEDGRWMPRGGGTEPSRGCLFGPRP